MASQISKRKTNPYNVNQFTISDPRQELFWSYYLTPSSDTFSNAMQSAIKAGYEETTSTQITTYKWFLDKIRRMGMLSSAEKVLRETIEMNHIVPAMGMFGPIIDKKTKKPFTKISTEILKIKQDSSKFVAERLGKDHGYASRTEHTGKNGTPIEVDHALKLKMKSIVDENTIHVLPKNTRNPQ